jgi:hypothetical protein
MDPKLRKKAAAEYLGVSAKTFERYGIAPRLLPGRSSRQIRVWPVSILDEFVASYNDSNSREHAARRRP